MTYYSAERIKKMSSDELHRSIVEGWLKHDEPEPLAHVARIFEKIGAARGQSADDAYKAAREEYFSLGGKLSMYDDAVRFS